MVCLQQLMMLLLVSACSQGCSASRHHHRSSIASGVSLSNSNSLAISSIRNPSNPCTGLQGINGLNCTAVTGQAVLVPYQGGESRERFSFLTNSSSQCLPAHGKTILHLDPCRKCRKYGRAYFHRFHDCILPSWAAFMAAVEAASGPARGGLIVVLPHVATSAKYYRPFLDNTTDFIVGDHAASRDDSLDQTPCFVGARAVATLFFENYKKAFLEGGPNAPLFMDSHVRLWNLPPCSNINASRVVVLQRNRTRIIKNLNEIVDDITKATGQTPYVHRGNESWRQNVELFRCADVLVGYHGAGLIHGIFMRAGTTVIELTTTEPLNNTQDNEARPGRWRSNAADLAPSYPHVGWVRLTIPWEDLKASLGRPGTGRDDVDHRVKNLVDVTVPEVYYSTISDLVKNALYIWGLSVKPEQGSRQLLAAWGVAALGFLAGALVGVAGTHCLGRSSQSNRRPPAASGCKFP